MPSRGKVVPRRRDWCPGFLASWKAAHVGRGGCISARDQALAWQPRSPPRRPAPTRWRLPASRPLSAQATGTEEHSDAASQDSGAARAAPAAKVGFRSPARFPRTSAAGVGSVAAAEPSVRSAEITRAAGAATRAVAARTRSLQAGPRGRAERQVARAQTSSGKHAHSPEQCVPKGEQSYGCQSGVSLAAED